MKIVMIDKYYSDLWYSWYLCKELSRSIWNRGHLLFYGPRAKPWTITPGNALLKAVWSPYLYPFQIFKEVIKDKPDVVHVQFEFGTFGSLLTSIFFPFLLCLLKFSRVKVVTTIHETIPRCWEKHIFLKYVLPESLKSVPVMLFKLYLMLMYGLIGLISDGLIVHSHVFRKILIEEYGINQSKIVVITHGVDDDSPTRSPKMDYWRKKITSQKMILCFGVFSSKKGLEDLIKAYGLIAQRDPEYMLVMAGDESYYYPGYGSKIRSLVEKEGLNEKVMFTGFISAEDAHALFSLAKIVVVPHAVSFSASGSLSLAMHFRKPIIATATPYFREMLSNTKEALLVHPGRIQELAQAIETLFHDEKLMTTMCRNVELKARELSWGKIAKFTIEVYRNICSGV